MNRRLPQLLAQRLAQPLPGPMVGSRFEGPPRAWAYDRPSADARPAAVLLLLYAHHGKWHLPFTLRPPHLAAHAGQVSLPGGAVEPGETSQEAALREFREELGAGPEGIEMLGALSPIYVGASNFLITPWLGAAAKRPPMRPNPAEVQELLEIPLAHLCQPAAFISHGREGPAGEAREGFAGHTQEASPGELREASAGSQPAPHFVWQAHRIWGATCMILGELVVLLEELGLKF